MPARNRRNTGKATANPRAAAIQAAAEKRAHNKDSFLDGDDDSVMSGGGLDTTTTTDTPTTNTSNTDTTATDSTAGATVVVQDTMGTNNNKNKNAGAGDVSAAMATMTTTSSNNHGNAATTSKVSTTTTTTNDVCNSNVPKKTRLLPPFSSFSGSSSGGGGDGGGGGSDVAFTTTAPNSMNNSNNKRSATDANLDLTNKNNANAVSNNAKQQDDNEEYEIIELGGGDDDDEDDVGCLHCKSKVKNMPLLMKNGSEDDDADEQEGEKSNVQVRCDECGAYICRGCHWCHEFQANHEIRVCDRCDGFYCKGCDEMDQCDDCGEVVCGSCSTLLSCKFCGGGLCEECATACGRCGIVLCSRDAKFAVDCDTCRLSYCLVCLASGSKEPCVRCGHRPSKRMEQLVHLRLKSIYKAFKSTNAKGGTPAIEGTDSPPMITNGSEATNKGHHVNIHHPSHTASKSLRKKKGDMSLYEEFLNANNLGGGGTKKDGSGDDDGSEDIMLGNLKLPPKFCHDLEQNYLAEKKKADEAAEALLAELEEEEEAKAQKKSKKKKKKEKAKSKQQPDDEPELQEESRAQYEDVGKQSKEIDDSSDEEDGFDELLRVASGLQNVEVSSEQDDAEVPVEGDDKGKDGTVGEEDETDPVEQELEECVENLDLDGIEDILLRLKGVPGRAVLRKNAKKALKRLKAELEPPPPEVEAEPAAQDAEEAAVEIQSTIPVEATTATASEKQQSNQYQSTSTSRPSFFTPRADTIVQIKSRLVGWMIGKGGQRIRDIMDESGSKIWIDQESVKGQEWRNVNISGDATSRELAMRLINDVVAHAPPPPGATTKDEVEIIYSSSDIKGGESAAWSSNTDRPANLTAGGSATATQTSSAAETAKAGTTMEILTCEPRFVALLIGKRGWTIKNIQDESGARVDINQNVTPRQIKISGTRASVDRAVGLVQDVLSYPHAQLHVVPKETNDNVVNATNAKPIEHELSAVPGPTPQEAMAASARLQEAEAKGGNPSIQASPADDRNESPPPIVGDAKSAISASSSLSSTPEPSMASSAKGLMAAAAAQLHEPVLPPTPEKYGQVKNIVVAPTAPGLFPQPELAVAGRVGDLRAGSGITSGMPTVSVKHHPPPHHDSFDAQQRKTAQLPPGLAVQGSSSFLEHPAANAARDGAIDSTNGAPIDYSAIQQLQPGLSPTARRRLNSTAGLTRAQIIASTPLSELMGKPGLSHASSSEVRSGGYQREDGVRSSSVHSRGYPADVPSEYRRGYERDETRRYVEGAPIHGRGYERDDGRRFSRSYSTESGPPEYRRGYDDDRGGRRSHHSGQPRPYGRYEEGGRRSFHAGAPRPYGGRVGDDRRSFHGPHPRPYDGQYEDVGRRAAASYQTRPPTSYDRGYDRSFDRGYDRDYDRRYEGDGRRPSSVNAGTLSSYGAGPRPSAPPPYAPGIRAPAHPADYGRGSVDGPPHHEPYRHQDPMQQRHPHHHHHNSEPPLASSHDGFNVSRMSQYSHRDEQEYRGHHQRSPPDSLAPPPPKARPTPGAHLFSMGPDNPSNQKADELGIIDSLFGGPASSDVNAATESLLAGLTGLTMSGDASSGVGSEKQTSGLWGPSSFSDWGGSAEGVSNALGSSLGNILSGSTQSFSQLRDQQPPSHQRPY